MLLLWLELGLGDGKKVWDENCFKYSAGCILKYKRHYGNHIMRMKLHLNEKE